MVGCSVYVGTIRVYGSGVDRFHERRRYSRDTYPESYISPSILVYEGNP